MQTDRWYRHVLEDPKELDKQHLDPLGRLGRMHHLHHGRVFWCSLDILHVLGGGGRQEPDRDRLQLAQTLAPVTGKCGVCADVGRGWAQHGSSRTHHCSVSDRFALDRSTSVIEIYCTCRRSKSVKLCLFREMTWMVSRTVVMS